MSCLLLEAQIQFSLHRAASHGHVAAIAAPTPESAGLIAPLPRPGKSWQDSAPAQRPLTTAALDVLDQSLRTESAPAARACLEATLIEFLGHNGIERLDPLHGCRQWTDQFWRWWGTSAPVLTWLQLLLQQAQLAFQTITMQKSLCDNGDILILTRWIR